MVFKSFIPFTPPLEYTIEELEHRIRVLAESEKLEVFGNKPNRSGGIGQSLEIYLGLSNNSTPNSDWGNYELKSTVNPKNPEISLFQFQWDFLGDMTNKVLILDYGKDHFSKHLQKPTKRLDSAIYFNKNHPDYNLILNYCEETSEFQLANLNNRPIATKSVDFFRERFARKFKNLILFTVKKKKVEDVVFFSILNVKLLENPSFDKFLNLIVSNEIKVEFMLFLELPIDGGKFHNRGCKLCASYSTLTEIYSKNKTIYEKLR